MRRSSHAPRSAMAGFALLSLALALHAQTPDEKARRAQAEAALDEVRRATAAKCGADVAVRVEWAQIPAEVAAKYSVASYCGAPLEALARLCEGERARAFIAKNVGDVVCRSAPKGRGALTVKGRTIDWSVDFDAGNLEALAKKELIKRL